MSAAAALSIARAMGFAGFYLIGHGAWIGNVVSLLGGTALLVAGLKLAWRTER